MKKGEKWSNKHREKMKIILNNPEYKKQCSQRFSGKNNPMYGKEITNEHRENLRISHLGQIAWNKGIRYPQVTGSKNGNWKGGTTPETHKRVGDTQWIRIANEVRKRDNYTCQVCGRKNCLLDAHHIIPYRITCNNNFKNLITLCKSCHAKIDLKINIIFILLTILQIAEGCGYIAKEKV